MKELKTEDIVEVTLYGIKDIPEDKKEKSQNFFGNYLISAFWIFVINTWCFYMYIKVLFFTLSVTIPFIYKLFTEYRDYKTFFKKSLSRILFISLFSNLFFYAKDNYMKSEGGIYILINATSVGIILILFFFIMFKIKNLIKGE